MTGTGKRGGWVAKRGAPGYAAADNHPVSSELVIITTGGTIGMRQGDKLLGSLADRQTEIIAVSDKDSSEMLFTDWARLAQVVAEQRALGRQMIITHGTDTMEEGAFYLAEVLNNPPLAIVGAMFHNDASNADGPESLRRGAQAVAAGLPGTAVVVGSGIFSAWSVQKQHSTAAEAFVGQQPDNAGNWLGQESVVDSQQVVVYWLGAESSAKHLRQATAGARGVIIAAPGVGNVPSALRSEVAKITDQAQVVLRTRCFSGPAIDQHNYPGYWDQLLAAGVQIENHLSIPKIRVRLLLSLGLGIKYQPFTI